jgi:hypothetical protein
VVASRKFGDVAAKPHGTRRLQFWSDEDVVRFLRGRKGDVPAAVEAIRKCVDWRDAFAAEYVREFRKGLLSAVNTVWVPVCRFWTNRFPITDSFAS